MKKLKLKTKLIIIFSIVAALLIAGVTTVFSYYTFFYKNNGSTLDLVEVTFAVNENNVKNKTDVVYFSTDDLAQGDGYEITLNYEINGTFTSTNAIEYSTYFNSLEGGVDSDGRDLSLGIEVYHQVDGIYKYVDTLYNLIYENSNKAVFTDYLGALGTNQEKFMLVYGEAAVVKKTTAFALKISVTSGVVSTDVTNFPYYYLNDIGKESADSILLQLPENPSVYGRTIVLMKDVTLQSNVTFTNVVGIDLNGHNLKLNNYNLTIKDTSEDGDSFISKVRIMNSKSTGTITAGTGRVVLNLSKTVIPVDLGLSNVSISSINMDVYAEMVQNTLTDLASQKRLMNSEADSTYSYAFDALQNLKYYVKQGYVSLNVSGSDSSVSFDSTKYTFNISGLTTSDIVYIGINMSHDTTGASARVNLSLYGKSSQDAAEFLLSYVPKTIDGSIYLPQYLPAFNAYVTWISFNDELIDSNGTVLPNGYIDLDSWVTQTAKLGFVLDQSGDIKNGIISDITIIVLSEAERVNLIHDYSVTMFDYYNTTKYTFSVTHSILAKKGINTLDDSTEEVFNGLVSVAKNDFGITLDYSYGDVTFDELKTEFETALFTKLGLSSVYVDAVNTSTYVNNATAENGSITQATQNGIPDSAKDVAYLTTYSFLSGNVITEGKTIIVSNGEESTTTTDLSNTLRVPFDTYSKAMTTPVSISSGIYRYEAFVEMFEIVSEFSGTLVTYQVDDEFKDYVEIYTDPSTGKLYCHVLTGKSPAVTTTAMVYADISGTKMNIPFTIVGIIHNGIEIKDANLYVELLANFDTNKDNILTVLETEHAYGTTFNWSSRGIVSLQGLRYFTNITTLTLDSNSIADIDDIAYLTKLTTLHMCFNNITDISALAYLDSLKVLTLQANQITSIEALQNLTALTTLNISFNKISNFEYIQNLSALANICVNDNQNTTGWNTVDTTASSDAQIENIRKSNLYYFSLLRAKDATCKFFIKSLGESKRKTKHNYDASKMETTEWAFSSNAMDEAVILSKIVTVSQVSNVISLPTYVKSSGAASYEIVYFADAQTSNYVTITRSSAASAAHVTNITINQIPVDNEVSIYAYTYGFAVNEIERKLTFTILQGGEAGQIELRDTSGNSFYVYASTLIPDVKLRAELFKTFANGDSTISYSELTTPTEVNLEFAGVSNLEGIQYFTGITSLNLRGNVFTNASDLHYVSYLSNLTTLYVDGMLYDFDDLVYFSAKDKASYSNTITDMYSVNDISGVEKTVSLQSGLTKLTGLYVSGSFDLNEPEVRTELYHVYLNNSVSIYLIDDTTVWDPINEEVSKLLGGMTTSATFVNFQDQLKIALKYEFYLFDDLLPIMFSLTYTGPTDRYYYNNGNRVANVYYFADNAVKTTGVSIPDVKGTAYAGDLFKSSTSGDVLTITYYRLVAFDFTTYASMSLVSATNLWNNKAITASTTNYSLAMNVQFNDAYKIYNDLDETDSVNNDGAGTSVNKVFGSVMSMIFVMDGITSQLYGKWSGLAINKVGSASTNSTFYDNALRSFYYCVTEVDGTKKYYYKDGKNAAVDCGDSKETAENMVKNTTTSGYVYYDGASQTKTYENGFIVYVSQLKSDFKYARNGSASSASDQTVYFASKSTFIYTDIKLAGAKSEADGLQYLYMVTGIISYNGIKFNDGHQLVNLHYIADIYGYTDISSLSTELPNLEVLHLYKYFMSNFADETGSDSDPSKLIASYFVYMPNLRTFAAISQLTNGEKGTPVSDWSAFLAYSYIPYGQATNTRFAVAQDGTTELNSSNILDKDVVKIGGMLLQDNYLYYYDPDASDNSTSFKTVYDYQNNPLVVTNFNTSTLTAKGTVEGVEYYTNLYDEYGNPLKASYSLFRKSQQNQLNYVYQVNEAKVNTGTPNQQCVFYQMYANYRTTVKTWCFVLTKVATDYPNPSSISDAAKAASTSDWNPAAVEISYKATSVGEYSEFAPFVTDLGVKVTGTAYDVGAVTDALYNSINWNGTTYTNMFSTGLKATLPKTVTAFASGYEGIDEFREFKINWYLLTNKNNSITSTNITDETYTFTTPGYYVIVGRMAYGNSTTGYTEGALGAMYQFAITDGVIDTWYEAIIDSTLRLAVFLAGGENATQVQVSGSLSAASRLNNDILKKYYTNIYTLEGIKYATKLTTINISGQYISYIPELPASIVTLSLTDNQIGDIGDIFDGSKYPSLTTVNLSKNALDLKENSFKTTYTTNITQIILGGGMWESPYHMTTDALALFSNISYSKAITLKFGANLENRFSKSGSTAFTYSMLNAIKTLAGKTNVTVYGEYNAITASTVDALLAAYDAVLNPTGCVSISEGTINQSTTYRIDSSYTGPTPQVKMAYDGKNGSVNVYQKMAYADYQLIITVNNLSVVKDMYAQFYENAGSVTPTLNGVELATIRSTISPRVLEYIYSKCSFTTDAPWNAVFNSTEIDIADIHSYDLDLSGIGFLNIKSINSYHGDAIDTIKFGTDNTITTVRITTTFSLLKDVLGSTTGIDFVFDSPVSRSMLTLSANGSLTASFANKSVELSSNNKYNYAIDGALTYKSLKNIAFSEITSTTAKYLATYTTLNNITYLHQNYSVPYYGLSNNQTALNNSVFKRSESTTTMLMYALNASTSTNGAKRTLSNGALINVTEETGNRYVLISGTSKVYMPKKITIGSAVFNLTYSTTKSGFGINTSNADYVLITSGTIKSDSPNIIVNVTYSGTASGTFNMYFDIRGGKSIDGEYSDVLTTWYVELQDGSLVVAGKLFSSQVLAANIFNGMARITFSPNVIDVIVNSNKDNLYEESLKTGVNGNMIMEEIYIDGVRCKVLRQYIIASIKTIIISNRTPMTFDGLEIFYNLKAFRYGHTGGGVGYDFSFMTNLQIEYFDYWHKNNATITTDFSFLNNSRDTLKKFWYGASEGQGDTLAFEDMSWLLACNNLEQVRLQGPPGIQFNPTFQYFLTAMYLKYHKDIVTYRSYETGYPEYTYSNLNISDDLKSAATIMYDLSSFDTSDESSFVYQYGYELFSKTNMITTTDDYYLPSYLYSGGEYYKLHWESLSTFIDVSVKHGSDVLTVYDYEDAYELWLRENAEESIYEFCKDYIFVVKFKNIESTTSYKAFISLKIEYNSKFEDAYTPVTSAVTDMATNYEKYYTKSYSQVVAGTEFVKNTYYNSSYDLLEFKPSDWETGTFYEAVYTQCSASSPTTGVYTRYVYTPYMYERILTVNLAKNNKYKSILFDNDAYSYSDRVQNDASILDGTVLSDEYVSVVSSNSSVVSVEKSEVNGTAFNYFKASTPSGYDGVYYGYKVKHRYTNIYSGTSKTFYNAYVSNVNSTKYDYIIAETYDPLYTQKYMSKYTVATTYTASADYWYEGTNEAGQTGLIYYSSTSVVAPENWTTTTYYSSVSMTDIDDNKFSYVSLDYFPTTSAALTRVKYKASTATTFAAHTYWRYNVEIDSFILMAFEPDDWSTMTKYTLVEDTSTETSLFRITDMSEVSNADTLIQMMYGRIPSGVVFTSNYYYSYDEATETFTRLSNQPTDWKTGTYYFFVPYKMVAGSEFSLSTKTTVWGIYLLDNNYDGLVTLTCTKKDGTVDTFYVYAKR